MNKIILSTGLAVLFCINIEAQNKSAIKFSQTINKDNAYKHLSVLASDEYEGRETGTKGAWMAADYIKNYFKSIGLKGPVKGNYFQPVELAKYEIAKCILTIDGEAKEPFKNFAVQASSLGPKGFAFNANEIVFVGEGVQKGDKDDFAGLNIEGKVVMVFDAKYETLKYLMDRKALAAIVIDPALDKPTEQLIASYKQTGATVVKNTNNIKHMDSQKLLTTIYISSATAEPIFRAGNINPSKPVPGVIKLAISGAAIKKEVPVRAENVLGFLEGSDAVLKKEILVVTGHYDHIGLTKTGTDKVNNGADDDGSGTTAVLMLANAFMQAKKTGHGPKRSILFMTVVGEEKGLWGSEWYSEHPIFPLENTITDLNIDMIGRGDQAHAGDNNFVYIIGSNMLSTDLDKIGKKANKDYININLDEHYNNKTDPNRFYYRSDHYNFAKHGIPVIFYFNGVHEDYHKPGDEVSKIDFPMLVKRTKLVYFTAWELANGKKRPVVDKNEDSTLKK